MAAIITEQFRRNSAKSLLQDIANSNVNYYVGLGKSDKWVDDEQARGWSVPTATGTNGEADYVKSNLITLLKADSTNSRLVIPRVNYKSGVRYKEYNPHDENCFYPEKIGGVDYLPCYVVVNTVSDIAIYLCLHAPDNTPSTSIPDDTTSYAPRSYSSSAIDNYVWTLIDKFTISEAIINTDQYVSINGGSVSGSVAVDIQSSSGGVLYGFTVENGGIGYASGPFTINFTPYTSGGTKLTTVACIAKTNGDGTITSVDLPVNYTISGVTGIAGGTFEIVNPVDGSSGAIIKPHITPLLGLAHTPSNILPSWFIGVSVRAMDDISADGFYIPYRQISILKNVSHDKPGEQPLTLGALQYLTLQNPNSELEYLSPGTLMTFASEEETVAIFDAYAVVEVDADNEYRVYYHQNETSGYGFIESTGTVSIGNVNTNTGLAYIAKSSNEYTPGSGEVIFVENRKAIVRAQSQTEEIKIIIQL